MDCKRLDDLKIPNTLIWDMIRRPKNDADRIHRAFAIFFWRTNRGFLVRLRCLVRLVLSPFSIAGLIRKRLGRLGKAARDISGKSILKQCLEQFYLAYFFSVTPKTYYLQEFYRQDGVKRARNHVRREALKDGVYILVKKHLQSTVACDPLPPALSDKLKVASFLSRHDIPTIPVIMEFRQGGQLVSHVAPSETDSLPKQDIFGKPRHSKGGRFTELWYWIGNGKYRNPRDVILTSAELYRRFSDIAEQQKSYLIQPLVMPHPDLEDFRINATPSLRAISYCYDKEIKVESVRLKFTLQEHAIVDNTHTGAVSVPVDLATGKMTMAVESKTKKLGHRWDEHELLNGSIRDRRVPYLTETVSIVKAAHALFPHDLVVGWDVLISEKGPVIIEGNDQPDTTFPQKAFLSSYGGKEVGKVLADNAEMAISNLFTRR